MMRVTLLSMAMTFGVLLAGAADAQSRGAPITQGVTSGEVAAEVAELRANNAALRARMTGLESDKATLNGKVETLEFLLSQTRDQINNMQADDAEIGRLISRLERRINQQDETIEALRAELAALSPETTAEDVLGFSDGGLLADNTSDSMASGQGGPLRIVGAGGGAAEDQDTADTQTAAVDDEERVVLLQGTLGTLSASALPGEAGPLFAEAKSRLLLFDYAGAEAAFRAFLEAFGDDPQAGEAQYWLAESLYQQAAYPESGQAYTTMIRTYPDDPRAPEALAKLARSMRLVGDTQQACAALDLLPQRYPNASGVTRNLAAGERVRSGCDS